MTSEIKEKLIKLFENIFKEQGRKRYKLLARVTVLGYQFDWEKIKSFLEK